MKAAKPRHRGLPPRGRAARPLRPNIRIPTAITGPVSCCIRHEDGQVTCLWGGNCSNESHRYGIKYSARGLHLPTAAPARKEKHVNVMATTAAMSPCACILGTPVSRSSKSRTQNRRSPYNNFSKLKRAEKRSDGLYPAGTCRKRLRQRTGEHPFGTIKHYGSAGHFLCKGKEKVTAGCLSALSTTISAGRSAYAEAYKISLSATAGQLMPQIKIAELFEESSLFSLIWGGILSAAADITKISV